MKLKAEVWPVRWKGEMTKVWRVAVVWRGCQAFLLRWDDRGFYSVVVGVDVRPGRGRLPSRRGRVLGPRSLACFPPQAVIGSH